MGRALRLRADELNRFGEDLGRELAAPAVVGLSGELGSGKTTLVRPVYHVDCYRLESPDEARDLGFDDMVREGAIVLVEWPERAGAWVPPLDRQFQLSYGEAADIRVLEEVP